MHESHVAETVAGVVALLLIASAVLAVTKHIRLPFTVALVVVGVGLSVLADAFPGVLPGIAEIQISPELVLYVFLPTLVFESAYNLDVRQLRHNLGPVLLLAVPGLLLSTFIIGAVVGLATPIPIVPALLLGAILSATDPVAVVALFKRLGAPERLTMLVEGESLFNDATSLVLAKILLGVMLAGALSAGTIASGALDFVVVFFGGLLVGWALGAATGYLLGRVESDSLIEITLTTVVAYMSFLVAEEAFHVSGVMATIAAGLTVGGWGRMKVSPGVRTYLEHFWEYIAYVANALIFLMVGLRVELSALWEASGLLVWVVVAMLVSRAVVVYGLTPLVKRLPSGDPVDRRYQTVMYWGGLRGAIALAIVLSLPEFEYRESFIALTMGAVLFTLLVQATTIEPLVRWLGLDRAALPDRFARKEGEVVAKERALERLPDLLSGGLFSGPIAERLRERCEEKLLELESEIKSLHRSEIDRGSERPLLLMRAMAEEKSLYIDMFNKGQLSERAFRHLMLALATQIDDVRYTGDLRDRAPRSPRALLEDAAIRLLGPFSLFDGVVERLRLDRFALDYEVAWGRCHAAGRVVSLLDRLGRLASMRVDVVEQVRAQYAKAHAAARLHLDSTAEQFPEFVGAAQERLGLRLMLFTEAEAIHHQAEFGTLPHSMVEGMQEEIADELRALRGRVVSKLKAEPAELLRKVPCFAAIPPEQFAAVGARMHAHTVATGGEVIRQGAEGSSLFVISRGVVRVSREENGVRRDVATLLAGDFFGEMALLHREPRSATVTAVTSCLLYELRKEDLEVVAAAYPAIRQALEEADQARRAQLAQARGA